MNKELIEMIDMPHKDRGKILLALATKGPMKSFEIANVAGVEIKMCTSHLGDMYKDSSYVNLSRKKVDGLWQYTLVGMKCKMSEARTVKAPRYKKDETNDVPFDRWRKVFCLMDSCCG